MENPKAYKPHVNARMVKIEVIAFCDMFEGACHDPKDFEVIINNSCSYIQSATVVDTYTNEGRK